MDAPDPESDRDDTDAGFRDTLEEEAYEERDPGGPGERTPGEAGAGERDAPDERAADPDDGD